jgi:hypothetical protein
MKTSGGCVASGGVDGPLEVEIKLIFGADCKNAPPKIVSKRINLLMSHSLILQYPY